MLLKVVISYVLTYAVFAEDKFDHTDSSRSISDEDNLTSHSEETTDDLVPLTSESISALDTTRTETNTPDNIDLTSASTNPSSSENQSNDESKTMPVTTVANDMTQLALSNLTHDNSSKLTGDLGPHGITYQKWESLTDYGKFGSLMPIKGGLSYGGKIYNQNKPRFPQRDYAVWKGSSYIGQSNTYPQNFRKMHGNPYPMNNFRGVTFHGVQFESNNPTMKINMPGDMHADDLWGHDLGSFSSEIPFSQKFSFGKWTPMHRSRADKFTDEAFSNWKPMMYGHMFGNMDSIPILMKSPSNSFQFGTTGNNFKGYNYEHDFGTSYDEYFPASIWK